MEVVHPRCCGLDMHQQRVVACVLLTPPDRRVERVVRTLATMTADLLDLADWLDYLRVEQVALASSSVDWRPGLHRPGRDEARTLVLVNLHHTKAVPGRKTDLRDDGVLCTNVRDDRLISYTCSHSTI